MTAPATHFAGTSGATAELYALYPLASAYLPQTGPGGETAMQAVGMLPIGDAVSAVLHYDLENLMIDRGLSDGRRGVGMPAPEGEPGQVQTRQATVDDYGKLVWQDPLDPTLQGKDLDVHGTQVGAGKLSAILERRLGAIFAATATPWGLADRVESALWTLTTSNPLRDIILAKQAHRAAQVMRAPELNAIHMGRNVWEALMQNTTLVSQFGGNTGAGFLTPGMLISAFLTVGIDKITIGPHQIHGGTVTLYAHSPDPTTGPCGAIWAHQGGQGQIARVERKVELRRTGYYVYSTGEYLILPEYGTRFADVTA